MVLGTVAATILLSSGGDPQPGIGWAEYSALDAMTYGPAAGQASAITVASGALFTEKLHITDTDEYINAFSQIQKFSNFGTSYGALHASGTLATHDAIGNPIVNPSVAQSTGGVNTFTYFVIARTVTQTGFYSDRFTPHDIVGSKPGAPPDGIPNGTNDGTGSVQEILVTVTALP